MRPPTSSPFLKPGSERAKEEGIVHHSGHTGEHVASYELHCVWLSLAR